MTKEQLITALQRMPDGLRAYADPDDEDSEISGVKLLEAEDKLSACCGEPPKGEIHDGLGICSNEDCKEHADFEGLPERIWLKQ